MIFKVGDLILVTKINSIFRYSGNMPKVGGVYKVCSVGRDITGQYIYCIETKDNLAHIEGVHPTPLLEELA